MSLPRFIGFVGLLACVSGCAHPGGQLAMLAGTDGAVLSYQWYTLDFEVDGSAHTGFSSDDLERLIDETLVFDPNRPEILELRFRAKAGPFASFKALLSVVSLFLMPQVIVVEYELEAKLYHHDAILTHLIYSDSLENRWHWFLYGVSSTFSSREVEREVIRNMLRHLALDLQSLEL